MFSAGTQVRLLHRIGDYPAGTLATVVEMRPDNLCEIDLGTGQRLLISCEALAVSPYLAKPARQ